MTVLGFHTTAREAVVWIDSQTLKANRQHSHFRSKMKVNPLAGAVCVSTGWAALADEAGKAFMEACDIDDAVRSLPKLLRDKVLHLIAAGCDTDQIPSQAVFLVGYSPMAGRVAGYRLAGDTMFEPVMVVADCRPDVPEFDRTRQPPPEDVVRIAQAQLRLFLDKHPAGCGGMLVAASIRDGAVCTMPLYDLNTSLVQGDRTRMKPIREAA